MFSRSDMRRSVLQEAVVEHADSTRARVKTWVRCAECGELDAKSNMQVDHKSPVVPIESSLEQMTWDELVDRIWCDKSNLQVLCTRCHELKSKEEGKLRRQHKKKLVSKPKNKVQ